MNPRITFAFLALGGVFGSCSPLLGTEEAFDFAHDVSPILAKVGCSAAECHGGATGQGGFKLSLFAENPLLDYEMIVEELDGRRLDLLDPGKSLFLRKPTRFGVKHKGGRLLQDDDLLYQTFYHWIEQGAPYRTGSSKRLTDLQLKPEGDRYSVWARFDIDGTTSEREVTHLALLESTNEQVAWIDETGQVADKGPGETWFLARYGKLSARAAYQSSFVPSSKSLVEASSHPLDRVWLRRIAALGLAPAPGVDAQILARRLHLDLVGRPPDPLELESFVNADPAQRIQETTQRLMKSEAFNRVFGRVLAGFFEIPVAGKDPRNATQRNERLRTFFNEAVARGDSLPEIARHVLEEPVGRQAWQHFADPRDRAEYVGRTMLGMRIGCARCHNHPLDRWTNEEHMAFSAYFTDPRPGPEGSMMAGKFFLPGGRKAIEPKLLPVSLESPPESTRAPLAAVSWMVLEGAREQFARNMANRVFGSLVGRSLVELPDDHRLTNPAIHEPMLNCLEDRFLAVDGDLKSLVTFIVSSQIYAASSEPPDAEAVSGDPERQYLARREARTLTSEELKVAIEFVLGVPIAAGAPPDSPLARQLYLLNSGMLQQGLATEGNQVDAILLFESDPAVQFQSLYQLILSRRPRPAEIKTLMPVLQSAEDREKALKDLAFALLASREFGSVR